jgi:hypothetical protein
MHLGTIGNLWYRDWATECGQWMRPAGRLLVLLTTLLVLVMPVTEHLYNWDHFLRGGQDVEFNLLAGLLFAAMVLLSMNGTMMQPLLMQPLMMQPVSAATTGSGGEGISPSALARYASEDRAASIALLSAGLDDPASAFSPCTQAPLRI